MSWYAYNIAPIDFGWHRLKTVQETLKEIIEHDERSGRQSADGINHDGLTRFLQAWENAQHEASGIGWEGDFRDEPRVFWIPYEDDFKYGFVFKQDNNGTTFVLSPIPLPWLDID